MARALLRGGHMGPKPYACNKKMGLNPFFLHCLRSHHSLTKDVVQRFPCQSVMLVSCFSRNYTGASTNHLFRAACLMRFGLGNRVIKRKEHCVDETSTPRSHMSQEAAESGGAVDAREASVDETSRNSAMTDNQDSDEPKALARAAPGTGAKSPFHMPFGGWKLVLRQTLSNMAPARPVCLLPGAPFTRHCRFFPQSPRLSPFMAWSSICRPWNHSLMFCAAFFLLRPSSLLHHRFIRLSVNPTPR